MNLLGKIYI